MMKEVCSPQYGLSENVEGKVKHQYQGSRRLEDQQQVKRGPGLMRDLHFNYCKDVVISEGHSWPKLQHNIKLSDGGVKTFLKEQEILANLEDAAKDKLPSDIRVTIHGGPLNNHDGSLTQEIVLSVNGLGSLSSEELGDAPEKTGVFQRPDVSGISRCGKENIITEQRNSYSLNLGSGTFRPHVGDPGLKDVSLPQVYNSAIYQPVVKLTRLSDKYFGGHSISTGRTVGSTNQKMGNGQETDGHSCKFCADRFNVSKDKLGDPALVVEPYGCTVCGKTFRFQCDLQFHILTHKLKRYFCTFCDKQFRDKCSVLPHFRTHSGERPFSCEVCKRKFSHYSYLINSHMRIHSGVKGFSCSICQMKFALAQSLKSHYLIHTGEKKHACSLCTKRFARQNELKSHMRIHSGQRPYSCKICQKTFSRLHTLKTHSVTHTGERPYACLLCPKTCTQASHLKSHMATHTGERRYACSLCDKKFTQSSHLKTHMVIHTGEKPHRCETCQRCFADRSTLKIHTRLHTGEEPYACKLCPVKFKQLSALKGHLIGHTEEKPYTCEVCQQNFRRPSQLRIHMSSSHAEDKPQQCLVCGKRFALLQSLKYHTQSHTDEKPFVCQICGKGFQRSALLKSHVAGHEEKQ